MFRTWIHGEFFVSFYELTATNNANNVEGSIFLMQIHKHLSALATALTLLTITSCANNQSKSDIKPQKIQTENQNKKIQLFTLLEARKK